MAVFSALLLSQLLSAYVRKVTASTSNTTKHLGMIMLINFWIYISKQRYMNCAKPKRETTIDFWDWQKTINKYLKMCRHIKLHFLKANIPAFGYSLKVFINIWIK